MRYLGGHLGTAVSALVDGQLDAPSAERAWAHVQGCAMCLRQVEHEGWVKRRLAAIGTDAGAPPEQLLGSLYDLPRGRHGRWVDTPAAWAAVGQIERHERVRRRTGIALVGAGSVSVAVLGFATLSGATLGISGSPTATPTTALTRPSATAATSTAVIAPVARVHGRLPLEGPRGRALSQDDPPTELRR